MKTLLNLVGQTHAKSRKLVEALAPDHQVLLIPEPDNPFDPNAIEVYVKLGYVKKEQAAALHPRQEGSFPGTVVRNEGHYVEIEIEEDDFNAQNT